MNGLTAKTILASTLALVLAACNSSNKTSKQPTPEPPPALQPITADKALQLDFTLPLSALGVDAGTLVGATINTERGEFVVLGESGSLVYVSPQGAIAGQREIQAPDSTRFTGIEFIGDGQYLLSTTEPALLLLQEQTLVLETYAQLDFDVHGVAYDETTGSAIVIDDGTPSSIVSISASGDTTRVPLSANIDDGSVTGLTMEQDLLLIASISDSEDMSLIISAALSGELGTVWSIESNTTSGLVLLDPQAPDVLTANSDSEQTVTTFETPPAASIPSADSLVLNASAELDFDQPSGIDFVPETSQLFYVTDFAEIRQGSTEGENTLLFELDTQQGSFEAIVYHVENDTISLLMSDEADSDSFIMTFDTQGNQLSTIPIPLGETADKFESMDYHSASDTYFLLNTSEGPKYLYRIKGGETQTTPLPGQFDEFVIAGMSLADDGESILFVTEEWEDDTDQLMAGLLIKLRLSDMEELARYSIAVEQDGEYIGLTDPSDVTIDEANNLIFITSDIDDSVLFVFDGF